MPVAEVVNACSVQDLVIIEKSVNQSKKWLNQFQYKVFKMNKLNKFKMMIQKFQVNKMKNQIKNNQTIERKVDISDEDFHKGEILYLNIRQKKD